jgi:hypothetical protein
MRIVGGLQSQQDDYKHISIHVSPDVTRDEESE